MQSCWVQREGQVAEQHRVQSGCALEQLLIALGPLQTVQFQLEDDSYASYPSSTPLGDLRADCKQDGRAAATALRIRVAQTQGPVFSFLSGWLGQC